MSRSVPALQQAMVRMLFDPAYIQAVYAGPVPDLTEPERSLLLRVDPRAWTTDAYRRSRGVHALIEEYPVTAAVMGIPQVDAFFSSARFAATLAQRGSLGVDFGDYAAEQAGPVAQLEQAIARARRAERGRGGISTRPGVEPLVLPGGALAFYATLRQRLGPNPIQTLASNWVRVPLPAFDGAPDPVLVERSDEGEVGISGASEALVKLLTVALTPRERPALVELTVELGCTEAEGEELIDDLLSETLLVTR